MEFYKELLNEIKSNLQMLGIIITKCSICNEKRFCVYDFMERRGICLNCINKIGDEIND